MYLTEGITKRLSLWLKSIEDEDEVEIEEVYMGKIFV